MKIVSIDRVEDVEELQVYTDFKENQLMHINEPDLGVFIAESPKVITRALRAGYKPISILKEVGVNDSETMEVLEKLKNEELIVYEAPTKEIANLTGYKRLAAAFRLMVEEDAGAAKHIIRLAVFLDNPETIEFGYSVWRVWMKGRVLVLGYLFHLAVEFGGGCLVYAAFLCQTTGAHGFQDTKHTYGIDVCRKFRCVETDLHMRLCGKIIYFVGVYPADDLDDRHTVAHVGVVQVEMGLPFQVRNAFTVVYTATADDAVHGIAFGQ